MTVSPWLTFEKLKELDGNSRERLTGARTYYVSPTGDDSADGLTPSTAFLTIQYALDTICGLDIDVYDVTVQLLDGTYTLTQNLEFRNPVGSGDIILVGNGSNTIIDCVGTHRISISLGSGRVSVTLKNLQLDNTGGTVGSNTYIFISNSSFVTLEDLTFVGDADKFVFVGSKGLCSFRGTHDISGNNVNEAYVADNLSQISTVFSLTQTFEVGGSNWNFQFIRADVGSVVSFNNANVTFNGSATGGRYLANLNGIIRTFGGGVNFFPGSVAGITQDGGQYS